MNNITVSKIHMVILMAHKFEATVAFYKERGFKCVFHLREKWAEFELSGVKLGVCPTTEQDHERRSRIVLEADDINAVYQAWKKEGVEFVSAPKIAIHGIMATFKDPDGNLIDLYQATPEKVKELVEKAKKEDCKNDECCKKTDGYCAKA